MTCRSGLASAALALLVLHTESPAESLLNPTNGNPLVPGYFADPCIRKFGDTFYLYATPDGWGTGEGIPAIWTSKDFVHWELHRSNWPQSREKWAPSVVHANGKYYMFSSVPCQTWVGVSDTPLGPWKNALVGGGPLTRDQEPPGTITLDAEVFVDDDGSIYVPYGTWWTPTIQKMKSDLLTKDGDPVQYFNKPGTKTPLGLIRDCMEAPYIVKRDGIYYLMYSDRFCQNSTYQVKYSTATSPFGPWTYGANNPILSTNADTSVEGPGHHSMLEHGGQDFIVYHRHAKPFRGDNMYRQIAADVMRFGPGATILPVKPTHRGIGFLAPSTKRDTNWVVEPGSKVSASASSSAGEAFTAQNVADINNGTLWKASGTTYPQWVQIDLGQVRSVKRTEIDFQYPQLGYAYKVTYSVDGKNWQVFADRSQLGEYRYPIDTAPKPVGMRYLRVTVLGDEVPTRPNKEIGIWNIKGYDGVDKPLGAIDVRAGADAKVTSDVPRLRLQGSVRDLGLPCKVNWSAKGPGRVTFSDPTDPESTASFEKPGQYVLTLTGKNSARVVADTVTVTVEKPSSPEILRYEFDEARDTAVLDATRTSKDGWLASDGDVKQLPVRGSGVSGRALAFDGSRSYVATPALGMYDRFAFSAWVKLDRLGNAVFFASADGRVRLDLADSGNLRWTSFGTEVDSGLRLGEDAVGRWIPLTVEFDRAQGVRFSLRGVRGEWMKAGSSPLDLSAGLRLGADQGRFLAGKMDSVRLYRSTLSDVDLRGLASPPKMLRVRDLASLKDGQPVELKNLTVTYAPRDRRDTRTTNWFYARDPEANGHGIEVRSEGDDANVGSGVSIRGILRTDPKTKVRYVELTTAPEVESAPALQLLPANGFPTVEAADDRSQPFMLEGEVVSISPDRQSLSLKDSQGQVRTVVLQARPLSPVIQASQKIALTLFSRASGTEVTLLGMDVERISPVLSPLERGLILHLPFNESAGNVASDLLDPTAKARIEGGSWMAGRVGNALRFDALRSNVVLPELETVRSLTIATWIKPRVLKPWQAIFHTDQFEPSRKLHLTLQENGSLLVAASGNSPVDVSFPGAFKPEEADQWKHLALTLDSAGRTIKLFVNGELIGERRYTFANPVALYGGMRLGSWGGNDRFLDGMIDDFRIYSRALGLDEVRLLAGR